MHRISIKGVVLAISILILFTWSIVSSLNPTIMLFSLTPSVVLILALQSGNFFSKRVPVTLLLLSLALLMSVTSTKHPFFYPIAHNGFIISGQYWDKSVHSSSSQGHQNDIDYTYSIRTPCGNFNPIPFNTPYSVSVNKEIHNVFYGRTTKIAVTVDDYPQWGERNAMTFWLAQESVRDEECIIYNKPLAKYWVIGLDFIYGYLLIFSYLAVFVLAVISIRNRNKRSQ